MTNIIKPMPVKTILSSVERVLKTGDSSKLTKAAYNCLYLMSGFIANYDIRGFQQTYSDTRLLVSDILSSSDANDPERYVRDTWFANQYGIEYCQSKTDAYKGLKALALKYQKTVYEQKDSQQKTEEMALAQSLLAKYGLKIQA
jgi:hypothetical protein